MLNSFVCQIQLCNTSNCNRIQVNIERYIVKLRLYIVITHPPADAFSCHSIYLFSSRVIKAYVVMYWQSVWNISHQAHHRRSADEHQSTRRQACYSNLVKMISYLYLIMACHHHTDLCQQVTLFYNVTFCLQCIQSQVGSCMCIPVHRFVCLCMLD